MTDPAESKRYSRHTLLPEIGEQGQVRFKQAKVLVVGAGGLGCPVLQYLGAAGIGTIGIVDFDAVDESNLQRQILYSTSEVGMPKAECAKRFLNALNPFIEINTFPVELNEQNALGIIQSYDLVVDGSDNFKTRYLVNDACVILGKPLVFGSVYRFEGQISVFNYKGGPTYRCLYPEPNELGSCAETGVLGVLPGTIGCLMATEALKIIAGIGSVMSGKLMVFDALNTSFNTFSFPPVAENQKLKTFLPAEETCSTVKELSIQEFIEMRTSKIPFQLIDVREESEYKIANLQGTLIPLNSLSKNLHLLFADRRIVVHCKSGIRSRKAAELLLAKGFQNVASLEGGMDAFLKQVKE